MKKHYLDNLNINSRCDLHGSILSQYPFAKIMF